jgi:hypothetical protein
MATTTPKENPMDITATITDGKWTQRFGDWRIYGADSRDNGQTITSPVVAVDRDRQLAQTKSGSIYHVPGAWPDLDLPAMDDFRARAGGAA